MTRLTITQLRELYQARTLEMAALQSNLKKAESSLASTSGVAEKLAEALRDIRYSAWASYEIKKMAREALADYEDTNKP